MHGTPLQPVQVGMEGTDSHSSKSLYKPSKVRKLVYTCSLRES